MEKFKKDFNSKIIISIMINISLLCVSTLYSYPVSKDFLRVPVGEAKLYKRMLQRYNEHENTIDKFIEQHTRVALSDFTELEKAFLFSIKESEAEEMYEKLQKIFVVTGGMIQIIFVDTEDELPEFERKKVYGHAGTYITVFAVGEKGEREDNLGNLDIQKRLIGRIFHEIRARSTKLREELKKLGKEATLDQANALLEEFETKNERIEEEIMQHGFIKDDSLGGEFADLSFDTKLSLLNRDYTTLNRRELIKLTTIISAFAGIEAVTGIPVVSASRLLSEETISKGQRITDDFLIQRFKQALAGSSRVFPIYLRHQSESDFNEIDPILNIIIERAKQENKKIAVFMEKGSFDMTSLDISIILNIWQKLDKGETIDKDLLKYLEEYIEDNSSKFRQNIINDLKSDDPNVIKTALQKISTPMFAGFTNRIFSFFQKLLLEESNFELYFEKPNVELVLAEIARIKKLFDEEYGALNYQARKDKIGAFWQNHANSDFEQALLRDKSLRGDLGDYRKGNPDSYVIVIRGIEHMQALERLLHSEAVSTVPYVSSWHLREIGCLRAKGMEAEGFDIPKVFSEKDVDSIISQEKELLEHVLKVLSSKTEYLSIFASSFTPNPRLDKPSLYRSINNAVREVLNTFASIGLSKEEAIKVYKGSDGLRGVFFNNIVSIYSSSSSLLERLLYKELQDLTSETLSTSDYYAIKTIAYELSQFLISNRQTTRDIGTLSNVIDKATRAVIDDGLVKGDIEKVRKKVDIICKKTIPWLSDLLLYSEFKIDHQIKEIKNVRFGI